MSIPVLEIPTYDPFKDMPASSRSGKLIAKEMPPKQAISFWNPLTHESPGEH